MPRRAKREEQLAAEVAAAAEASAYARSVFDRVPDVRPGDDRPARPVLSLVEAYVPPDEAIAPPPAAERRSGPVTAEPTPSGRADVVALVIGVCSLTASALIKRRARRGSSGR